MQSIIHILFFLDTVLFFLGKLTLKIPWNNVYVYPVEASMENLFLLVAPNTEITYDPVKEEKWKQEAKQAEIEKVEAAKKREREKGNFLIKLLLYLCEIRQGAVLA